MSEVKNKIVTVESLAAVNTHVQGTYATKVELESALNSIDATSNLAEAKAYTDTLQTNLTGGSIKVKFAKEAEHAETANTAYNADVAERDYNDQVIHETYATKEEAKAYADSAATTAANAVKDDLLNGAGAAYDTLKELGDLIDDNADAIDALETVAAGKADKGHTHDDRYYTETETDAKLTEAKAYAKSYTDNLSKAIIDGDIVAGYAERDVNGRVIDTTYATKDEVETLQSNLTGGSVRVKFAQNAVYASSAEEAVIAERDYNDNVIHETYVTKAALENNNINDTFVNWAHRCDEANYAECDINGRPIDTTYATKEEVANLQATLAEVKEYLGI